MRDEVITTDVLIIGAGLAGERTAIEAATQGLSTIILSLVPPRRSHSTAAQGGMQAALGNMFMGQGDSPDVHFQDTVRVSDWGCEQDVARLFANLAPVAVRQMSYWGVPWSRVEAGSRKLANGNVIAEPKENEGLIAARDFGGTKKWRTCCRRWYRACPDVHLGQCNAFFGNRSPRSGGSGRFDS